MFTDVKTNNVITVGNNLGLYFKFGDFVIKIDRFLILVNLITRLGPIQ